MGLAEKRATMEFQNKVFGGLKEKIFEAAGFEMPMEINWDSLAEPNQAAIYEEYWTKIFFEPLIGAFKTICVDDLGKQALREALKKIEIANSRHYCDTHGFSFSGGVLKLDHELMNADHVRSRTEGLIKILEKAL